MSEFAPRSNKEENVADSIFQEESVALYKTDYAILRDALNRGEITEIEFKDALEDLAWETLLEYESHKVNEGTEAIILEINSEHAAQIFGQIGEVLNEEQISILQEEETFIAKLYKIFKLGTAEREMALHRKAYEIISQSNVSDDIRVPRILSSKNQQKLRHPDKFKERVGVVTAVDDAVEYLAMEAVDGVDLATYACQETILETLRQRYPESSNDQARAIIEQVLLHKIKDHTFDPRNPEIRTRFSGIIGSIYRVSGHSASAFLRNWDTVLPGAREFILEHAPQKVEPELTLLRRLNEGGAVDPSEYISNMINHEFLGGLVASMHVDVITGKTPDERGLQMRKLFADTLGYQGRIKPDLYDKLNQALQLLHENGFYHRDLHERNIMVTRDGQQLYLIDFGKSKMDGSSDNSSKNYEDPGGRFFYDDSITMPAREDDPGSLLYVLTRTEDDVRLDRR